MSVIIVPTDLSDTTAIALQVAASFSETTGSHVKAVYFHDGYGKEEFLVSRKGNLSAQTQAQNELEQFIRFNAMPGNEKQSLPENILERLSSQSLMGDPATSLIKLSKEATTELIVMGASGAGVEHNKNLFYGSVAKAVSIKGESPVLLVPKGYDFTGFRRIAYSFRGEAPLRAVHDSTHKFFAGSMPSITYVHLKHDNPDEDRSDLKFLSDPDRTAFMEDWSTIKMLEPGELSTRLIEYINEENIDLLIMGRRKRGFIEQFFIDTEIRPLLKRCNIPLLIVPIEK